MKSIKALILSASILALCIAPGCSKQTTQEVNIYADNGSVITTKGSLTEETSFGSNPGNLRFFYYVPSGMDTGVPRPLVVVLHGCTQTEDTYRKHTEWDVLADKYKWYLAFPHQKRGKPWQTGGEPNQGNQPYGCFNFSGEDWSLISDAPADLKKQDPANMIRGQGENESIIQMVIYMKSKYKINNSKVYVTGLSAGGAMVNVMLATWPDVFAGGAPMAGVAYRCANSAQEALDCMGVDANMMYSGMKQERKKTAQQWGDLARSGYAGYSGPYPKVIIWHGSSDQVVDPVQLEQTMLQWTNVHGVDQTADNNGSKIKAGNAGHTFKEYKNSSGQAKVATVLIDGMSHGISVDPGTAEDQGGQKDTGWPGPYSHDKDIYSSYYTAKWWGLFDESSSSSSSAVSSVSSSVSSSTATSTPVSSLVPSSSSVSSVAKSSIASSTPVTAGDYTLEKTTGTSGSITYNAYYPLGVGKAVPVVVALHGCYNTGYENASGWKDLAKKYGFAVIFPMKGNGSSCWANRLASGDYNGEMNSIVSIMNTYKGKYQISGAYVTGLSSGAAAANCLLEYKSAEFKGGAPMSGPDCQSPGSVKAGLKVFFWSTSNGAGGDTFSTDLPGIFSKYVTANGGNANSISAGTLKQGAKAHEYKNYNQIAAYIYLNGMSHGIAVDPGTGIDQGGSTSESSGFANDWDIFSSYYTAKFWGIIDNPLPPVSSASSSEQNSSMISVSSEASSYSSSSFSPPTSSTPSTETIKPTVAITGPKESGMFFKLPVNAFLPLSITGTAADNIAVSNVTLKFFILSSASDTKGTVEKTVDLGESTSWTYSLQAGFLTKYKYFRIEAYATDSSGNVSNPASVRIYTLN